MIVETEIEIVCASCKHIMEASSVLSDEMAVRVQCQNPDCLHPGIVYVRIVEG